MDRPELAKSVKIMQENGVGRYWLEIDGQPFPWATIGGVKIEIDKSDLTRVTISIAVEPSGTVEKTIVPLREG